MASIFLGLNVLRGNPRVIFLLNVAWFYHIDGLV